VDAPDLAPFRRAWGARRSVPSRPEPASRQIDEASRCRQKFIGVEGAHAALQAQIAGSPRHLPEILRINNGLGPTLGHNRVFFVQHPPENALGVGFTGGSFIACAGSIGNCDQATEGGIPKSSRSGHSLKSLAFRGCVQRRDVAERRVERDKGTNPQGVSPSGSGTFPDINLEV
jgi:hypothetical protein